MSSDLARISEDDLIASFDELVADDVIVYGPHEVIQQSASGFPIEFRLCPSFAKKPHTVGASNPSFSQSRKWGPGSDMYCPDERLIVAKLNGTHDLALNLFCVDRPQLLLLTLDSYRRQFEPLDNDDFKAVLEVLRRWNNMYIIYNCSEVGGCSRTHKHMQGLRGPPFAFDALVHAEGSPKVPFRYFMHHFEQGFQRASAVDLLQVYNNIIGQCRTMLGLSEADVCPHNVVLWNDRIIVIPRRKGFIEGASANAAGMLGSIWVPDKKEMDEWMRLGCANVLRELGVPR
ncbi:hypothetical protein P153DRAFT_374936 [Dothidotthia symphoricarpi CBS 119687]|uniref:Uncharacterized protein n=1 Tax=Dothidotthia symphoricarpi CBS 119687 TaxID=1392245 RepID=A0A6A6AJW5_9PLEO|nr:uncharacterized protein P153DRAFT_374936 [Dothidotthia symphoricarpi CBS 119687]KAF2131167.1 hypothetical protein P153DRAFT_374936 [Dothidotthia symphoricarpi CBS 119687]